MQTFRDRAMVRRPQRVAAPDASLARETALRTARPARVGRAQSIGAVGDVRRAARQRWVSGVENAAAADSVPAGPVEGGRDVAGSR